MARWTAPQTALSRSLGGKTRPATRARGPSQTPRMLPARGPSQNLRRQNAGEIMAVRAEWKAPRCHLRLAGVQGLGVSEAQGESTEAVPGSGLALRTGSFHATVCGMRQRLT